MGKVGVTDKNTISACVNGAQSVTDGQAVKLRLLEPMEIGRASFCFSDHADELKEFAEKVDAPVCDTLMGKGAFNGTDERYSGMLGMHGTKASNLGVSHCDLLIAVGTRFSDRVLGNPKTFAKNAKILQIDVDPVEINKNICASTFSANSFNSSAA